MKSRADKRVLTFVVSDLEILNCGETLCVTSDSSFHKCPRLSPDRSQCSLNGKLHTVWFGSEKCLFVFWAWRSRTHGDGGACGYLSKAGWSPCCGGAQLPSEPRQVDGAEGSGAWDGRERVTGSLVMEDGGGGEGVV